MEHLPPSGCEFCPSYHCLLLRSCVQGTNFTRHSYGRTHKSRGASARLHLRWHSRAKLIFILSGFRVIFLMNQKDCRTSSHRNGAVKAAFTVREMSSKSAVHAFIAPRGSKDGTPDGLRGSSLRRRAAMKPWGPVECFSVTQIFSMWNPSVSLPVWYCLIITHFQ